MLKLTSDRRCEKHLSKDKIHFCLFLIAVMFFAIAYPQQILAPFVLYNMFLLRKLTKMVKNSCWY